MDLSSLDNIQGLDYKKAMVTLANMPALYIKILNIFIKKFDTTIDELNAADGEAFTIKIHSLKSTLRNLGMYALGDIAQEIETHSKQGDWNYVEEELPLLIEDVTAIYNQILPFID